MVDETTNDSTPDPSSVPDDQSSSPLTQVAKPSPFTPAPAQTPAPVAPAPKVAKLPTGAGTKFGTPEPTGTVKTEEEKQKQAAYDQYANMAADALDLHHGDVKATKEFVASGGLAQEHKLAILAALDHPEALPARSHVTLNKDTLHAAVAGPDTVVGGTKKELEHPTTATGGENIKASLIESTGLPGVASIFTDKANPDASGTSPLSRALAKNTNKPAVDLKAVLPDDNTAGTAMERGLLGGVSGLTSPENLALIASMEGAPAAAGRLASSLKTVASTGFTLQMAHDIYKTAPEVKHAVDNGDFNKAAELLGRMVPEAVFTGEGLKHLYEGGIKPFTDPEFLNQARAAGAEKRGQKLEDARAERQASRVAEAKKGNVIDVKPIAAESANAPAGEPAQLPPAPPHVTFDSIGGTEVKAPEPATRPSELAPNREVMIQDQRRAGGQGEQTADLPALHPEEHAELEAQAGRPLTTAEAANFRNNQLITQTNQRMAATGEGTRDEITNAREPHRAELEGADISPNLESRKDAGSIHDNGWLAEDGTFHPVEDGETHPGAQARLALGGTEAIRVSAGSDHVIFTPTENNFSVRSNLISAIQNHPQFKTIEIDFGGRDSNYQNLPADQAVEWLENGARPGANISPNLESNKTSGVSISANDAAPGSIAENTSAVVAKNKSGKEIGHVWVDFAPKAADLTGEKTAEINHAILDDEYQKQGIGKQLYIAAIEKAKEKGFSRIVSDTERTPAADAVWNSLSREYSVTKIGTGDSARYSLSISPASAKSTTDSAAVSPTLESRTAPDHEIKSEGPEWERTHNIIVGGKKVGSVMVKTDPTGHAQIAGSQVAPDMRGQGLAQSAYRAAIAEAQANGATRITSDSTNVSSDANRVWEKLRDKGFPVENITHPNGQPGYQIDFENPATPKVSAESSSTIPVSEVKTHIESTNPGVGTPRDAFRGISPLSDFDWRRASVKVGDIPEPKGNSPILPSRVKRYKQQQTRGSNFPAVVLTEKPNGGFSIQDGAHRIQAAHELGVSNIDAYIGKPKQHTLPASLESVAKQAGVAFRGVQQGVGDKAIAIFQDPVSKTSFTVDANNWSPEKFQQSLSAARERMKTPEPQFEQALARRGEMPNQTVNLAPAYGATGKYVGGHIEHRLPGETPEERRAQYAANLGNTQGTALMPVPKNRMTTGGTEHDLGSHELAHSVQAALEGFPTEGSEVMSHLHPETHPFAAATTKIPFDKIPGAVVQANGSVGFSKTRMREVGPAIVRVLLAAGHVQQAAHGMSIDANAGLFSDNQAAHAVAAAIGFLPEDIPAFIAAQRAELAKQWTPEMLAVVKNAAATREEGLSKTLLHSAAKVQDVIQKVKEAQNAETKNGDAGRTRPDIHSLGGKTQPGGESETAKTDLGGHDEKAVSPRAEARKVGDTSEKLVARYGTTDDPLKAGFILPDGRMVPLHIEHDSMLKTVHADKISDRGYSGPLRENFIKDENVVRTRYRVGKGGPELVFSVPKSGVNDEQVSRMRQAIGVMGRNGNAVMEVAEPRGASTQKEFVRPSDIEPMLREIGVHPEQTVAPKVESRKDLEDLRDVHEEYMDRQNSTLSDIVDEYNKHVNNVGYTQHWSLVPAGRLTKIWNDYAKLGFVRDEKGIDQIAETVLDNIHKIEANTILTGHTPLDPNDVVEDVTGNRYNKEHFYTHDTFFNDAQGGLRISDIAIKPLQDGATDLMLAKTPEAKLQAIDHILSIVHRRSDLAGNFVEGGTNTLDAIAGRSISPQLESRKELAPNKTLQESAQKYAKENGMAEIDHSPTVADEARAEEIARTYDAAEHAPNDPKVKAAYDAFKSETLAQFHHLRDDLGLKFEPQEEDPYHSESEMMDDIKKNNRLKVFTGSGTGPDHPLSEIAPGTGGQTYNTVFRWVHDAMGHAAGGHDFSENGEKSATETHAQMYSDLARPAMRTETEGQTSWYFHNPKIVAGKATPGEFAEQKAFLLPDVSPDWHKKAGDMAAKQDAGGINPRTGKSDTKGTGVELIPELREPLKNVPTADDFHNFYEQRKELYDEYPQLRVGWDNNSGEAGGHEINVGAVGPGAPAVAKKLDQIAAFDIEKGENIPTGGSGKTREFPDYPLDRRLEDLGTPSKNPAWRTNADMNGLSKNIAEKRKEERWDKMTPAEQVAKVKEEAYYNVSLDEVIAGEPWQSPMGKERGEAPAITYTGGAGFIHQDGSLSMIGDSFIHDVFEKEIGMLDPKKFSTDTGSGTYEIWGGGGKSENTVLAVTLSAPPSVEQGRAIVAMTKHLREGQPDDFEAVNVSWPGKDVEVKFPTPGSVMRELAPHITTDASISPKLESRKAPEEQNSLALETPKAPAPKQLTGAAKGATTPLLKQPLTIEGTGDNGRTTLFDLAGALNKWSQEGLKPDKEIKNALDRSRAEMTYQLAQDIGDANWYKKDTKDAIKTLQDNGFPELEKPTNEKLFRTMWAITSYGVDPDMNLTSAAEAWKQYKTTGKMPLMADEKTNWPGYSGIKASITLLNKLLDDKGEQGAMDWLLSKHPVSEIRDQKLKTHTSGTVPGKASDERYGMFIFGPKAGAFALNLQGVSEHTTVDVWGARAIRRWTGTLTPENVTDAPVTPEEARNFHHVIETLGKEFGLDTADAQAVLWSFEHDLYAAHGVGEAAKSYKTAAEKYVQRKQEGNTDDYIREQSDLFGERYGSSGKKTEGGGKNASAGGRAQSGKKGIDAQSLIAALGGLKKPADVSPEVAGEVYLRQAEREIAKKGEPKTPNDVSRKVAGEVYLKHAERQAALDRLKNPTK